MCLPARLAKLYFLWDAIVGWGLDPADPVPVIEWRVELNQVR